MRIQGKNSRTIWNENDELYIIDQTTLPHNYVTVRLEGLSDVCHAISAMLVRGAGLIGVTAGFGMWQAAREGLERFGANGDLALFEDFMKEAATSLIATRPTASNLERAVRLQCEALAAGIASKKSIAELCALTKEKAIELADEDASFCERIGQHGKAVIEAIYERKKAEGKSGDELCVNVLTHCNAGSLAFVDFGSALAPIYAAHDAGIPVHVWVDETRPRQQGSKLTAWELSEHGLAHTLISDGAAGYCMQKGKVDMAIVGADCVTAIGDVANKLGTYHVALAAKDAGLPFYVAFPSSTFELSKREGFVDVPIEVRSEDEVRYVTGMTDKGELHDVRICPEKTKAFNPAFDITPARLIAGLITERGICPASEEGIKSLFD